VQAEMLKAMPSKGLSVLKGAKRRADKLHGEA
jgi:hypothetical protein